MLANYTSAFLLGYEAKPSHPEKLCEGGGKRLPGLAPFRSMITRAIVLALMRTALHLPFSLPKHAFVQVLGLML